MDFKYRIWDEDHKCFVDENNDLMMNMTVTEAGATVIFSIGYYGNRKIIMYSEITDNKGEEIYEGDIIEFYNDEDYILVPGKDTVIFELGAFQLENEKYGSDYLGNMDIEDMCIRVIGNIYENPELLKSEVDQ